MRTKVTKQGIVWRHELALLETTTFGQREPSWMGGYPAYEVRVGYNDITVMCYNGETLPPLGSTASVDVWVDEPNDNGAT